jgi:type IV pilus assembly protein PilE
LNKQLGFTLIELMVSVAIVGLLIALALPSYQASVRKSNRADAQISLTKFSSLQEKYFFQNNQYSGDMGVLVTGTATAAPMDSDDGHYSIAVTLSGGGSAWSMIATAQDNQASDTDCATITLNSLGTKGGTSSDCW